MRRSLRLRANSDFQRVRRVGKSVANPLLVLLVAPNPEGNSRFGFAVGKKVGGAVVRNKIKRRLRERTRLYWQEQRIKSGQDVVIIARDRTREADYATLSNALTDLLRRSGLLRGE